MPVLIGIPVHNDLESFQEMMKSLINSTSAYDKILIVESNSTDGTKEYCDLLPHESNKIKVIHANTKTPLEAYNIIFDYAIDNRYDLLVTQTDVIFPRLHKRDWLKLMEMVSKHNKDAVVMPINGGGISGPDYIDGFEWVGGWCTYYPHSVLKKVGKFDDEFPNGYGVDIDHSYRCSKVANIIKMQYWVDHHMMNSREHDNDPNAEQAKQESAKYFRKKWKLQS